jgi:hypothetical protein
MKEMFAVIVVAFLVGCGQAATPVAVAPPPTPILATPTPTPTPTLTPAPPTIKPPVYVAPKPVAPKPTPTPYRVTTIRFFLLPHACTLYFVVIDQNQRGVTGAYARYAGFFFKTGAGGIYGPDAAYTFTKGETFTVYLNYAPSGLTNIAQTVTVGPCQ